ncbi:hypothetical protein KR018_005085 [Drosophila ironensis]|nr:hypothetical protein KR018_005085 [Drosophila ironensis]
MDQPKAKVSSAEGEKEVPVPQKPLPAARALRIEATAAEPAPSAPVVCDPGFAAASGSGSASAPATVTTTATATQTVRRTVLRLRLSTIGGDPRLPREQRHVAFHEGVIDNEHMNKRKSKCCCIYRKPHPFGESSSSTDDECEHCFGHPEVRARNRLEKRRGGCFPVTRSTCCLHPCGGQEPRPGGADPEQGPQQAPGKEQEQE